MATYIEGLDMATCCDKAWNITKQLLIDGHLPSNKKEFQLQLADRLVVLQGAGSQAGMVALMVTATAVDPTDNRAEDSAADLQIAVEAVV